MSLMADLGYIISLPLISPNYEHLCCEGVVQIGHPGSRELTVERTKAGLEAARKLGRYGGRKPKMTLTKVESAKKLLSSGMPARDVAQTLDVSVPTLYRWIPAGQVSAFG